MYLVIQLSRQTGFASNMHILYIVTVSFKIVLFLACLVQSRESSQTDHRTGGTNASLSFGNNTNCESLPKPNGNSNSQIDGQLSLVVAGAMRHVPTLPHVQRRFINNESYTCLRVEGRLGSKIIIELSLVFTTCSLNLNPLHPNCCPLLYWFSKIAWCDSNDRSPLLLKTSL